MDLSIGEIVLYLVIGWILLQITLGFMDAKEILRLREQVDVLRKLNDIIHQVKIEKIGDVEYWFDEDDGEFLGQGKTLDEVIAHLKSRFPDHVFLIKGLGGLAKQTDWKLMSPEEFSSLKIDPKDI